MRDRLRALTFALLLALGGCKPTALVPASVPSPETVLQPARMLWGQAASMRAAQAVESDLPPFGTVSLLNGANQVAASGTTDAAGRFSLNPFVAFSPATHSVYVLDLTKRFETTNEGAALRLRTLVSWTGSQWTSISGTTSDAGGVLVNSGTTAVAAIQGLRGLAASNMLGAIAPATGVFSPGATGIPTADFSTVQALVTSALAANLDPVRVIVWSASDNQFRTALDANRGKLLFDLKQAVPLSDNPSPIRTRFGTGFAVSAQAGLFLNLFGGFGTTFGSFSGPGSVTSDPFGNIYISNWGGGIMQMIKFDSKDRFLLRYGAQGSGNGQFQAQGGVDTDALGNVWVADGLNHRIQKFDPYGNFLLGVGQGQIWQASQAAPSPATSGNQNGWLNYAHFLRVDRAGNIWVTEWQNHRVQAFSPSGGFLRGIGNGTTWTSGTNAASTSSSPGYFNGPSGLAFDPDGNLWVNDRNNHRVQKFSSSGAFLGSYGGPGVINSPQGIAIDAAGNAWITELNNNRVLKFAPSGVKLAEFGATGSLPAQFAGSIQGIDLDRDGNLLVVDYNNFRVQRFAPASTALKYDPRGCFDLAKGTVETWVRPTWAGVAPGRFNLFEAWTKPAGIGDGIALFKNGANVEVNYWPHTASGQALRGDVSGWEPGTDHHVAFTWGGGGLALFLDGRQVDATASLGPIQVMPPALCVGTTNYTPAWPAEAVFGSLRVSDYPKTPVEILRDYRQIEQD